MAQVKVLAPADILGPKPPSTALDSNISLASKPQDLPFDPEALKRKYIEERDKRLKFGQAKGALTNTGWSSMEGPLPITCMIRGSSRGSPGILSMRQLTWSSLEAAMELSSWR